MKILKKTLKYTGISLLVLIALAFLLPVLFKGKIVAFAKKEINASVLAKVEFAGVDVSLFRHFPKLTVGLEDISVVGLDDFRTDTLLSAKRADVSVDLWTAIRGNETKVHGVYLDAPRIRALVNKEGKANWDIAKPDTATTASEPSSFKMRLDAYAINDGYVFYRDESAGMQAEITGLNHKGSGDFTQDAFKLTTRTEAVSANFNYGGIPYLASAKTAVDAEFDVDNRQSRYGFNNAAIRVNDLDLTANGYIQLDNDSTYSMDLQFAAPSTDFKHLLSLVPAVYKNEFDQLKTSGTAAFKGFVKGVYGPQQLPAYDVSLEVKDGFFQYPDLPQPVKNVQVQARFSNTNGKLDNTVVDVQRAHLEFGNDPFDFRLLFKNPETAKYVDAAVKGKLNLAGVGQFIKLENGTKLSGLIEADAFAKGSLHAVQQPGSGAFGAGGFFKIRGLNYSSNLLPVPLRNGDFDVEVQNTNGTADATVVNISRGHLGLGSDPFDFTLRVTQPVTAVRFSGKAKGRLNLEALAPFAGLEKGSSLKGLLDADATFSGSKADIDAGRYDAVNTEGYLNVRGLRYASADYPEGMELSTASLQFSPQLATLSNAVARFKGTTFKGSGSLQNAVGYALGKSVLSGTLNLSADKITLNDWMQSQTATATASGDTAALSVVPVPKDIHLTVNASADEVQYDKVSYRKVSGALIVKDETVRLQNITTQALDGTIAFNGSYSTRRSHTQPDINLSYAIANVDVQKAFYAFNMVQKLMPLGKALSGKLTSEFSMAGKLNGELMPDLSSLTGNGNLLLVQGVLSKFVPLEKIASSLNVDALKDISLKDVKTQFEFANGKVLVKPFSIKVKEIEMQVGGVHSLDQSMDYTVALKLPRKYMGTAGNNLLNNLAAGATAKGIPVQLGETVDLNVKVGGSLTAPQVKTDLKQAAGDATKELKQQAAAFVQQKVEATKQTVKDSLTSVKKQVVEEARQTLVNTLTGNKDSTVPALQQTKEKAAQTLKSTMQGFFKKKEKAPEK